MMSSQIIESAQWQARREQHLTSIRPLTEAFRNRRSRGEMHPVHDFLFNYYPYPPGRLEHWHPSVGQVLEIENEEQAAYFSHKHYQHGSGEVALEPSLMGAKEFSRLSFSLTLLQNTSARPPFFGCHGLHEWAMVYRSDEIRHRERAPLRLSPDEIAAVVESQPLACTHFDAFRFFTPLASPRNRLKPTLESRPELEQPGCVHANMDLYKWSFKAMPWMGSDFLRETFFLALELRELDMRASPYDLSDFGYSAIPIETAAGRSAYVLAQQTLASKAAALRGRMITTLENLLKMTNLSASNTALSSPVK